MNKGTKIRTALRIAVSLNTAIYAVTAAIGELQISWLTMAWAVFTVISDFVVAFLTTYFNNDYTETACEYTGLMRQAKAEGDPEYEGEIFFDDIVEEEVNDDEE